MRFPPELLDDIRSRIPVSQVVARKVALKRAGREFRGLSPFKQEKSPSFFVNDQKGFYHCFASGEHGDIFTFLIKTEGITFPEAVERLAGEAGVPMPKLDPREEKRADERARLYELMQAANAFFVAQLKAQAGTEARKYLVKRGLKSETIDTFGMGYAPNSKSALKEHLAGKGFSLEDMIATGMLISGEDIPVAYDRFRHRIMLPIMDLKGRIIAFGGRALDPNQPAKYLNSPETPLFHKGHNLYNAHRARPLAYERKRLIVVEGYLDVVALAEAGFGESVAPLGTAITEDQVKLLWRMVDEPILCLDGDAAGQKAAFRAIDTVLPHLSPGHSIRFAFLPDGLDPDDLVRRDGAAAMSDVLKQARPLVEVLWEREWKSGEWTTPERRAQLERQIKDLVEKIADPRVRQHYGMALRHRLNEAWGLPAQPPAAAPIEIQPAAAPSWDDRETGDSGFDNRGYDDRGYDDHPYGAPAIDTRLYAVEPRHDSTDIGERRSGGWREGGQGRSRWKDQAIASADNAWRNQSSGFGGRGKGGKPGSGGRGGAGAWGGKGGFNRMPPLPQHTSALLKSALVSATAHAPPYREALLVRTLVNHPWLLDDHSEAAAQIDFSSKPLSRLRDAIVSVHVTESSLDRAGLRTQLTALSLDTVLETVERAITHKGDKFSEPDAQPPEVEAGWRHTLAMHERQSGLRKSLAEAERAFHADGSEEAQARIVEIQNRLAHMSDVDAHEDGSA
jgi:DNA primase catalytic core